MSIHLKEALLYERRPDKRVLCHLCPHRCQIEDGGRGICGVRENHAGSLYTLAFGRTTSQNVDTVEKKPLFHFYPGSTTYSLSTFGCNMRCPYCINWQVSQVTEALHVSQVAEAAPEQIVAAALQAGCRSIGYTYVEPTIFFEYLSEIAALAHRAGLYNLLKTNGFMTEEVIQALYPYLSAANVDLKSFRESAYRQLGGRLQPVLESLQSLKARGLWIEVSTVIIPGLNDNPAELRDIAAYIADTLGIETPWHVVRFFPAYKMQDRPPTPIPTLHQAREIGLEQGLQHVYIGNLLETGAQDTVCADCGHTLIRRRGTVLQENFLTEDRCPDCGTPVPGVGMGSGRIALTAR